MTVHERAFAKVNLVLHVGPPREDGLHPLCSLLASVDLADDLTVAEASGGEDEVECPGLPNETLCRQALGALREALPDLPPLAVDIHKRIPVAAGLGGGSADAAAVLRAGNEIAGGPLPPGRLRELAAAIGSDVPSQVESGHALIGGVGERVEHVDLPAFWLVLVPQSDGLPTREVYAELDRMGGHRDDLSPEPLRRLAGGPLDRLAAEVENDLEPAALSLRPELAQIVERLRDAGALAAGISGSGPTVFGMFESPEDATGAAAKLDGAQVVESR
jgi:4-diphosphocytidyl-2-C-methyl-D-erythritol kinase